jgi:hypothetical protein
MTETLGNDISLCGTSIRQAIRRIHEHYGMRRRIIGDRPLSRRRNPGQRRLQIP